MRSRLGQGVVGFPGGRAWGWRHWPDARRDPRLACRPDGGERRRRPGRGSRRGGPGPGPARSSGRRRSGRRRKAGDRARGGERRRRRRARRRGRAAADRPVCRRAPCTGTDSAAWRPPRRGQAVGDGGHGPVAHAGAGAVGENEAGARMRRRLPQARDRLGVVDGDSDGFGVHRPENSAGRRRRQFRPAGWTIAPLDAIVGAP